MKRYDFLTDAMAVVYTAVQTERIFQIISLVLTCISFALSIIFTVYQWYKKAKEDGKITKDELKELGEIAKDAITKGKDIADKIKDTKKK